MSDLSIVVPVEPAGGVVFFRGGDIKENGKEVGHYSHSGSALFVNYKGGNYKVTAENIVKAITGEL